MAKLWPSKVQDARMQDYNVKTLSKLSLEDRQLLLAGDDLLARAGGSWHRDLSDRGLAKASLPGFIGAGRQIWMNQQGKHN